MADPTCVACGKSLDMDDFFEDGTTRPSVITSDIDGDNEVTTGPYCMDDFRVKVGLTPAVSPVADPGGAYALITLTDADALRDHLDALNEAGTTPVAVGIAPHGRPFLITLVGPYVESEDVLFDSPWQGDIDYGERIDGTWVPHPPHCDDCQGQVHGIEDIQFPVTVMVVTEGGESRG